MAPHGDDDGPYHPVDSVKAGMQGAMIAGAAGLLAASVKNAMRVENVGITGVFTRSGGIIFTFTAVGGTFEFGKYAAANLRQKNDHYNAAIGGFLAGTVLGMRTGRIAAVLGRGALTSGLLAVWDYTGGLTGVKKIKELSAMDDFEKKEYHRKNRRRPIETTLADIGEGRGIQPPGYRERRKERLEKKYGVVINPVSALAE